ncbi:MAG TPA: BatA domain-containing protein [Planctomycetota bacterium]
MTLGRPEALWLLALGIPIVAAHLFRGRVRRLAVPALFLWEQVLPVEDIRSGLRKLRHLAGLFIALLALAVLASAIADPTVRGITREPRRFVLVIDTSPEMTPDRLTEAKGRARDFLARLGRRDSAAILDGGGVVEPSTSDAERRDRALDRMPRSGSSVDPATLLESAKAADPGASVTVLTSRLWPAGDYSLLPIGTAKVNVALTEGRLGLENGRHVARAVTVNVSDGEVEARLEIRNRGRLLRVEPMRLARRERRQVSFVLDPGPWPDEKFAEGAWLEFRIRAGDPRPQDDAMPFVVPATAPVTVVLVAEGDPDQHLLFALELLEQSQSIRLVTARAAAFERVRSKWGTAAVYIFDRVTPPQPLSDGGYLVVGAEGPAARVREVEAVKVVDWDRDAAVHRWMDYPDVKVKRAWVLKGSPLVTSDKGPIAVWGRRQGLAWIQFGFSFGVGEGDFALTPSFPVFLRNAALWLAEDGRRAFPRTARAGGVLVNEAPLADPEGEVRVTEVAGGEMRGKFVPVRSGEVRIPVARPGLLKLEGAGGAEWVAVEPEAPVDLTQVPVASGPGLPEPIPWWRDLPYTLVAAAVVLALLAAEWVLYQRGWI